MQAVGFADLTKRIQEQDKATTEYQKKLEVCSRAFFVGLCEHVFWPTQEEQAKLVEMKQKHEVTTKVQIQKLRTTQAELSHRLLKVISIGRHSGHDLVCLQVMTKIEVLRAAGVPLLNEEMEFRRQLESIKRKLAKPAQFQARVSELASIVRMQEDRAGDSGLMPSLDAENTKRISEVRGSCGRAWLSSVLRFCVAVFGNAATVFGALDHGVEEGLA